LSIPYNQPKLANIPSYDQPDNAQHVFVNFNFCAAQELGHLDLLHVAIGAIGSPVAAVGYPVAAVGSPIGFGSPIEVGSLIAVSPLVTAVGSPVAAVGSPVIVGYLIAVGPPVAAVGSPVAVGSPIVVGPPIAVGSLIAVSHPVKEVGVRNLLLFYVAPDIWRNFYVKSVLFICMVFR